MIVECPTKATPNSWEVGLSDNFVLEYVGGRRVQEWPNLRQPYTVFESAPGEYFRNSSWIMIWDTSIWRLECSNRLKIRSAQECYLCLRYVV
jgi:hypothetical protein